MGVLVTAALAAGCHEADNLGGWTDYRLAVETDFSGTLQAGDVVRVDVRMVDGRGQSKPADRPVTVELMRFGGDPIPLTQALDVTASSASSTRGPVLRAGRFRLRARASDSTPWLGQTVEVTPADAVRLGFRRPPSNAFAVDRQRVEVEVLDRFGNRVTEPAVSVTLADETRETRQGRVTFPEVALEASGTQSVTATAPGLQSATAEVTVDTDVVGGRLTYASVPVRYTDGVGIARLDYASEAARPIAGAPVLLLKGEEVVAETVSALNGSYRFAWPESLDQAAQVTVRVLAQSVEPAIRVLDNTASGGGALYALNSEPLTRASFSTDDGGQAGLNLHAASGWTGQRYGQARAAAPFALLDAMRRATLTLVPDWAPSLPLLTVYWSERNRPVNGEASAGEIGTSHFDTQGNALYILGAEDVDTDEYDVPVVVHEWGHYLVARGLMRSDTIGGTHGGGTVLDPRTAFEEGFCNTLAALAGLTPKAAYGDTLGISQQGGFWENLDRNNFYELRPGWHSEESVQASVYDLTDAAGDADEAWDDATLGWGGLLAALEGARETDRLLTIFTLLDAVLVAFPEAAGTVQGLSALHDFSDLEDGGWEANLPLFRPVGPDGDGVEVLMEAAVGLSPAAGGAHASVNRWITFEGDSRAWEVQTLADRDVDIALYQDGWPVLKARSTFGDETVIVTTQPGARYVANVRSWDDRGGPFSTVVLVQPQTSEDHPHPKKAPPRWFGPTMTRSAAELLYRAPPQKNLLRGAVGHAKERQELRLFPLRIRP